MTPPILSPFKTCANCNQEFPRTSEYFYSDKRKPDGLYYRCKKCFLASGKSSRDAKVRYPKQKPGPKPVSKEHKRETARRYREANKEILKQNNKRWKEKNIEMVRANTLRAVAKRAGADGRFNGNDVKEMYLTQDGCCGYCGIRVIQDYHVDHMMPLSRGGSNWPENLIICCALCNGSKSTKTLEEWKEVRGW